MSMLNHIGRPWIAFDANNQQHRTWYFDFLKKGTWGATPVRFFVSDEDGDLITLCQRKLIDHYLNKEFGEVAA